MGWLRRCLPWAFVAALALAPTASASAQVDVTAEVATAVLAHYLRGLELRVTDDLDGAVQSLEAARALVPDDPDLAIELARGYAAARLYAAAAAAYQEAGLISPSRVDLALAQARFHLVHAFRVRIGAAAAERALRLRPDDPEVIALRDLALSVAALADPTP